MANDSVSCRSGEAIYAGKFNVAAFWASLAAGWSELTTTGTKPPPGILAFSGCALLKDELLFFGGGHTDYWGDDFWGLQLNALAWSQHYTPDFGPNPNVAAVAPYIDNVNYPGAILSGGLPYRPISRHTYRSVNWIKSLGKISVGGASTYSGSSEQLWENGTTPLWLNSPKDQWYYDTVSKTFEYLGSELLTPAFTPLNRWEMHQGRDRGYGIKTNISNKIVVYEFNPQTRAWTPHATQCPASGVGESQCVVDEARDCLWIFWRATGSVGVYKYDLSTQAWTAQTTSGTPPTSLPAEMTGVVSTKSKKILFLYNAAFGMKVFDPATGAWTSESTHASMTHTAASGLWKYDRRRQCGIFAIYSFSGPRMWAYKD